MNKRFCINASVCALMAVAAAGSAMAGSGSYTTRGAAHEVTIDNGVNKDVELHFKGADRIRVTLNGTLEIVNRDGHVWYYRPDVYQTIGGKQKSVETRVGYIDKDRVTLRLGKVDPTAPVVVSPGGHSAATM
jgi:hypothetical protein